MTVANYIMPFLFFPALIMVLLLCYAPARNHLRYQKRYTVATALIICAVISVAIFVSTVIFSQDFGFVNILCVIYMFIMYHRSLTFHISQSAAIFLLISTIVSFLGNFSIIFDALQHPEGKLVDYSLSAFLFLLALFVIICGLFVYPLAKYGSYIFDHLNQPIVWWMYASVAAIFYLFNLRMIIHNYSTLHTNMVGIAYITVMVTMFILLIMLNVIFYFIVNALIQKAELDDRNRILEMQEKQFESLRDYLDSDAKARHDFRQTIYTLTELSDEKDYQAIDEYLHKYRDELPQKETIDFCEDNALNALLNHYSQKAEKNEIRTDFQVSLPAEMNIDSIDLCSVVGNILENAVIACCDIDVEKRFIRVVISAEQNSELYIAIANSFSGKLRQIKDRYLSTHKGGNGIGLISVEATAARYGGSANWSNDNGVFYSDVVLVNNSQ